MIHMRGSRKASPNHWRRRPSRFRMERHRIAAIGVAACLLVYAGFEVGVGEYLWRTGCYVGICLGLIWFGPALGQYTGPCGSRYIGETTPGILMIAMGWLLLLLTPLVVSGIKARMAMGW